MNEGLIIDDTPEKIDDDSLIGLAKAAEHNLSERRLNKNQKKNECIKEIEEIYEQYKTRKIEKISKTGGHGL